MSTTTTSAPDLPQINVLSMCLFWFYRLLHHLALLRWHVVPGIIGYTLCCCTGFSTCVHWCTLIFTWGIWGPLGPSQSELPREHSLVFMCCLGAHNTLCNSICLCTWGHTPHSRCYLPVSGGPPSPPLLFCDVPPVCTGISVCLIHRGPVNTRRG